MHLIFAIQVHTYPSPAKSETRFPKAAAGGRKREKGITLVTNKTYQFPAPSDPCLLSIYIELKTRTTFLLL